MTPPNQQRQYRPQSAGVAGIGYLIFFSRWLQAPLYVGLIIAQLIYVWVFAKELWHLGDEVINHSSKVTEATVMLAVLGLIDVVMISNLLIMVIIGGYETFVSRIRIDGHPDQPEWLSHVNANVLKVKLAMAIIGISSIHLLKTFIEVGDIGAPDAESDNVTGENYTPEGVFWQVIIHTVFIISAIALAWIDKLSRDSGHPALDIATYRVDTDRPAPFPRELDAASDGAPSNNETQALYYERLARELRQAPTQSH